MLFDTLLEDYSPLNKSGEPQAEQPESDESFPESKAKPKVIYREEFLLGLESTTWLHNLRLVLFYCG